MTDMKQIRALQRAARASEPEAVLAFQLGAVGIAFAREVKVIDGRKFRFDFQINPPDGRLLVEIDGMFGRGKDKKRVDTSGHRSIGGAIRDREKSAIAIAQGYVVMRVAPSHVKSGQALQWVQQFLLRSRLEARPLPLNVPERVDGMAAGAATLPYPGGMQA